MGNGDDAATSASLSQIGQSPSGLLKGSWVMGWFRDGNSCQEPVVMGSFHGCLLWKDLTQI